MSLEFDAVCDGDVLKPKTPLDLPNGTKLLITKIVDQGEGKPMLLIGHIERPAAGAQDDKPSTTDAE